jgi:tryptophanyl-tRNA synthetase
MRPTGRLHLGHYHGVLKNWVELQHSYECYYFVADWHALTTHYEDPRIIAETTWDMVIDWLAAGVSPGSARLFIQSRVPEHAELHLLLSMITPLGWLERVPSFKDQQERLKELDLATYGLTREVARRFNHMYGREADFEKKAETAIAKMGKKNARLYREQRRRYQERGDQEALEVARALLETQQNISFGDKERLFGFLEGSGKIILPEPQALLTQAARMPGLDGQKMSKSYANTIELRADPDEVSKKLRTMPTDPARVRRSDPGDPKKCPVWQLHQVYSDDDTRDWVVQGCRSAGIGCLECKQPVIDKVVAEIESLRERAREYEEDPNVVREIIAEGTEAARDTARDTLDEVRKAMGVVYR